jgi:hypothetical protein
MSAWTRWVAVAVNAASGTPGNSWRSWRSSRYSGRKSWPHSEMQCASSTAKKASFVRFKRSRKLAMTRRSGATYSSFTSPRATAACRRRLSAGSSEEFTNVAATPSASSRSTWSFMSAISGETTTAMPSVSRAGSW